VICIAAGSDFSAECVENREKTVIFRPNGSQTVFGVKMGVNMTADGRSKHPFGRSAEQKFLILCEKEKNPPQLPLTESRPPEYLTRSHEEVFQEVTR
jgi:hypothetical protein